MCALETPSRRVLEETPARVFTLLNAVGTVVSIHDAMSAAGLTDAEVETGWALVHEVCNFKKGPIHSVVDESISSAVAELDAWDEPNLARIAATVTRLYPDCFDELMAEMKPAKGPRAVIVVERMLDRLDEFAQSTTERKRALVATLATRGYDADERARLRELIKVAKSSTKLSLPPSDPVDMQENDLIALYDWYREWATTARTVITRRDHLIKLGLASRRRSK
jgi:hypothetical protein